MKFRNRPGSSRLLAALLLGLLAPAVMAAMPAGEYACKVITRDGRLGLVLVQADSKAQAAGAAADAEAFTFDGGRGRAETVSECIDRNRETFPDYQFQQFYESIPL